MLTFTIAMATMLVLSACEYIILKAILPSDYPGPELENLLFNFTLPLFGGALLHE
jgi:hypothetical protein